MLAHVSFALEASSKVVCLVLLVAFTRFMARQKKYSIESKSSESLYLGLACLKEQMG